MAETLYRPTIIRWVKDDKRVPAGTPGAKKKREKSKTWRGRYLDRHGKAKTVALFDDKQLSASKLSLIAQKEREIRAGVRKTDPFEVHRETPLLCPKCSGAGYRNDGESTIACEAHHLGDFRRHLESKAGTERHINQTIERIRCVLAGCRFATLDELNAGSVADWLGVRRKEGLSSSTSNAYLVAVKSFGNWLMKSRRTPDNPFAHLSRVNAKVDIRISRRALTAQELSRLVAAAEAGPPFRELSGPDRAMLYTLAVFTGLRVSELASLTEKSFDLRSTPATVTVEAACSKHRREDVLPLHPALVVKLTEWLQARQRKATADILRIADAGSDRQAAGEGSLFPGSWTERAADMMRCDLEAARQRWLLEAGCEAERQERGDSDFLKFETDAGRADFHALRHTFISNLAASGVHPKLAKELARHSTITLTMDRYAHVGLLDMNSALESLPDIPEPSETQRMALTGTSGPIVVAPMVATNQCNHRSSQESSLIFSQPDELGSPSCNLITLENLHEQDDRCEKWGCSDLNREPTDYESAALTD